MSRAAQPPRPVGTGPVYRFSRAWLQATVSMVAGSPYLSAISIGSGSWPSPFVAFLQTFDMFRIDSVTVTLAPRWNVSASTGLAFAPVDLPSMAVVRNYDDTTAPTTFDAVFGALGAVVRHQWVRPVTVRSTPGVLVYTAGSTGAYATLSPRGTWLNTNNFSANNIAVPCAKFAVQPCANLPGDGQINIFIRMNLSVTGAQLGGI